MKWLVCVCLTSVLVFAGCSPPAGTVGDENDPATSTDLEPIDEEMEDEADTTGSP